MSNDADCGPGSEGLVPVPGLPRPLLRKGQAGVAGNVKLPQSPAARDEEADV